MAITHLSFLLAAILPLINAADPGQPNLISDVENRRALPVPQGQQVITPVRVLDIPDSNDAQIIRENGRLRVEVKANTQGFIPDRFATIKAEALNLNNIGKHLNVTSLDGGRPQGRLTPSSSYSAEHGIAGPSVSGRH